MCSSLEYNTEETLDRGSGDAPYFHPAPTDESERLYRGGIALRLLGSRFPLLWPIHKERFFPELRPEAIPALCLFSS